MESEGHTEKGTNMKHAETTLELQTCKPLEVERPDTINSPTDLLRLAVEKGADVGTIERLMAVRRELQAAEAKKAFDESMGRFQAECPTIVKSKNVMEKNSDSVRYRFAPLDHIVKVVRPLLQQYGFSYQIDAEVESGWVKAACRVTHNLGHSETSSFKVPVDPKSFMSEPQKFASALTFAKRYAFTNAFGILTGDHDNDGRTDNMGDGPEVVKKLTTELWGILKPVRGTESNWVIAQRWLIDECCMEPDEKIGSLDAASLRVVINKAKDRLKA